MRIATLDLTPDLFLDFCKSLKAGPSRSFKVKENALPDDARVIRVALRETGTIAGAVWTLFIESEAFNEIGDGVIPPSLPQPVLEAVYD